MAKMYYSLVDDKPKVLNKFVSSHECPNHPKFLQFNADINSNDPNALLPQHNTHISKPSLIRNISSPSECAALNRKC